MENDETTVSRCCPNGQWGFWCRAISSMAMICALPLLGQEPVADESDGNGVPAEAAGTTGLEFENFAIIIERNIFDPNRRSRSREPEPPSRTPEPKIDVMALTGTLSGANGTFAFFDSDSQEFQKTARVGERIADFVLKQIEQSEVALERDGDSLRLEVGQQLRRVDEGDWTVTSDAMERAATRRDDSNRRTSRADVSASSTPDSTSDTTSASAESSPSGEGPSEALKRLLERRKQEQAQ